MNGTPFASSPTPPAQMPLESGSGLEEAWTACLRELGLEAADLLAASPYDPGRRTYRIGDAVHKVRLKPWETTADLRFRSLAGEYELLEKCRGVRGVPRVRRYVDSPDAECLELDYVDGAPVEAVAMSVRRLATVSLSLTGVLIRLAMRGISHNDVVPSNVLVSGRSRVTLIDFDQASVSHRRGALLASVFGISKGACKVQSSLTRFAGREFAKLLPTPMRQALRSVKRARVRRASTPKLAKNPSPRAVQLASAWKMALQSDASAPGVPIAYYAMDFDGCHFPGERPWADRWATLRGLTDYKGKRVLELGCNMGLLSVHLLAHAGASEALGVDHDGAILRAARLVSEAFGVNLATRQIDFDLTPGWEDELHAFKADVAFALNVLNWVSNKDRLLAFIGTFDELVFEGHDDAATERARLEALGFQSVTLVGLSERSRPLFHCLKSVQR